MYWHDGNTLIRTKLCRHLHVVYEGERVSKKLSDEDLEKALEILAVAINQAGEEKEMLFLSKLCFTLANQLGDITLLEKAIDKVNTDL